MCSQGPLRRPTYSRVKCKFFAGLPNRVNTCGPGQGNALVLKLFGVALLPSIALPAYDDVAGGYMRALVEEIDC